MCNMRCHHGWIWECAGKRSSKTFKGAAVKGSQHTQLPFDLLFMQLSGKFFPYFYGISQVGGKKERWPLDNPPIIWAHENSRERDGLPEKIRPGGSSVASTSRWLWILPLKRPPHFIYSVVKKGVVPDEQDTSGRERFSLARYRGIQPVRLKNRN